MDKQFMWLIVMGNTSAYSVWLAMKEDFEKHETIKMMAYKNVNKRILRLAKLGVIKEIKPDSYSIHGRRDYKVTNDGMYQLRMQILSNPNDITKVIEYMDRYAMDKKGVANLLLKESQTIVKTLSMFFKRTNLPKLLGVFTPEGSTEYAEMQKADEEMQKLTSDMHKRIVQIEKFIERVELSKELSEAKPKDKKKST